MNTLFGILNFTSSVELQLLLSLFFIQHLGACALYPYSAFPDCIETRYPLWILFFPAVSTPIVSLLPMLFVYVASIK